MYRLAILLASWAFLQPAWANKADVRVDTGLTSGVNISATIDINASAETVWQTLTDYNRLNEFVPNLVVSRVISAPGRPTRVEQRGDSGVLSFAVPDHVVLAMEERPPTLIRFRAVSGSVLAMNGEWRISGAGLPIRLTYRAKVMPVVPPPPFVSEGIIRDEIGRRIEAVSREAEKRHAQKSRG